MSQSVNLSASGPPETVLDPEPADALERLAAAEDLPDEERRRAVAAVVADHPRCLHAWAALGDEARDQVEAYAAYRVGYHRGLDRLRANGWRGSGYVRWVHPQNTGFLRSLDGLRRAAEAIGEADEAERCAQFLAQLDPAGRPA
ncbi:DUF3151 domain-containing protein [Acidimicrobiia bacterium EGI L10123]|uniref:DUF3151 family protein n=1 Tax=Salinilacustrithrix flava TaxID=2957203 RepID=UPI003D7C20A9|nr:DUF3151 domain-containing protein [Acidimicrobiia bacterium EGI L10123]